jgi:transcriptional regulator of acetoin/glycerol metabolism
MMSRDDSSSGTLSRDVRPRVSSSKQEPLLFVAFHAKEPFAPTSRHDLGAVDEVHLRRGTTRETIRTEDGGKRTLVFTFSDPFMSGMHARLRRRDDVWWVEDAGSKNGTWLDGARIDAARPWGRELLEVGHTFLLLRSNASGFVSAKADHWSPEAGAVTPFTTLSPSLGAAFGRLTDVAASNIPVHVHGESGTGKELVSREVHRRSARTGAFVPVNCGALPAGLVESELFGFRKGAFSGATEDREGLVRAANGGTLFLDEVGDLPMQSQAAFLRILQERSVMPVGLTTQIPVDFRLISATHRDLDALASGGKLRDDLLARLGGFRIELPRLADRLEDLGTLVGRLAAGAPKSERPSSFTPEAGRALLMHSWPQNIRELERRLALAFVLAKGEAITADDLFDSDGEPAAGSARPLGALSTEDLARREEIVALLRQHGGNVTAVARAMGKARVQVQRWIRRYGIDRRAI